MPDVDEAFSYDDFSRFYHLENDATVNKLRGIKNITLDKYELSKFLGKYRVVSSLVDDSKSKKFTSVINKIFNAPELIDNYTLWERVLEIFITDKDYKGFVKFVERILSAIDAVEVTVRNHTGKGSVVKDALKIHLDAGLNRVLSLLWGEEQKQIIGKVAPKMPLLDLRYAYLTTRMSNKYVMALPSECIITALNATDYLNVNFTSFESSFELLREKNLKAGQSDPYKFLPYFEHAQDIAFSMLLDNLPKLNSANGYFSYLVNYLSVIKPIDESAVEYFPNPLDL